MMKRLLALMICLLLLPVGFGESADYASYTTDELIDMRNAINEEIASRTEDDSDSAFMAAGFYTVGVNLPAGTYELYNDQLEEDESSRVGVYTAEGYEAGKTAKAEDDSTIWMFIHYVDGGDIVFDKYIELSEVYRIDLEDGMVIDVMYAEGCYIRKVSANLFD